MILAEIEIRLTEIFKDILDLNALSLVRNTTASDIEEWDSLAHISLLIAIEKEFNIKLSLIEVEQLQNVGDMLDLIYLKTSKA
jgi:acyl carrier protein